jgi:hypothetical protein
MPFKMIAVYTENDTKPINKKGSYVSAKTDGTYSYHCVKLETGTCAYPLRFFVL